MMETHGHTLETQKPQLRSFTDSRVVDGLYKSSWVMDTNGCNMLSDSNLALFFDNGGCCGSAWGQHEELESL